MIAITVVLWSTIEVLSKLIQADLPPLTIGFLRFFIGGAALLPLALIYGRRVDLKKVSAKDWVLFGLLTFLGISLAFSLFHTALYWLEASAAATIISTVPLFTAPLSVLLLRERFGPLAWIGLLLGGGGIFLVYISESHNWKALVGTALMVVMVLCFSIYSILMKDLNRKMDPRFTTPLSLFIGSLFMVPFLVLDGSPLFRPMTAASWSYLFLLSVVAVGIAYLIYFVGLSRVSASKGNSLMYIKPFMAGILAVIFLGEWPSAVRISSIIIVTLALYLIIGDRKLLERFRTRGKKE